MDANTHDRIFDYRPGEFVAATPHLGLVLGYLAGTGAHSETQIPELGLSLVELPDVNRAATQVRSQREEAGLDPPDLDEALARRRPLERVLSELRVLIGHRYGGWVPDLGKNRVVQGLHLFPYLDFGGAGAPRPVPDGTLLETFATNPDAGRGARVVILDTAIYPNAQLAGRYLTVDRRSLLPGDGDEVRQWWTGHSTFLAGLILRRAPAARLEIESILRPDNEGADDLWSVAGKLVRYADSEADVLNLSFGCFTIDGQPPLVLERAIARLTPRIVVVAAAGNYGGGGSNSEGAVDQSLPGPTTPVWPAAFANVVAVGATDKPGEQAGFSPRTPWVDLLAPGVDVTSTYLKATVMVPDADVPEKDVPRDFYGMAQWSGTSQSAAAVSGAIAARTVRGQLTAYEALDNVRDGVHDPSSSGIEVAQLPPS
jgi:hypothetical protein